MKIERRIQPRIYGPRILQGNYRLRSNKEIYERIEDLETTIRKRRLRFYGHMVRMDSGRLNKQIFDKIYNLKSQNGYVRQMKEELGRLKITDEDCLYREKLRERLHNIGVLVKERARREHESWTEERRAQHSEIMKELWGRRNETVLKIMTSAWSLVGRFTKKLIYR